MQEHQHLACMYPGFKGVPCTVVIPEVHNVCGSGMAYVWPRPLMACERAEAAQNAARIGSMHEAVLDHGLDSFVSLSLILGGVLPLTSCWPRPYAAAAV
jgi:hypothetical protein